MEIVHLVLFCHTIPYFYEKTLIANFTDKKTRSPAEAGDTCLIIFEFVLLMRDEVDIFKNLRIGLLPKR